MGCGASAAKRPEQAGNGAIGSDRNPEQKKEEVFHTLIIPEALLSTGRQTRNARMEMNPEELEVQRALCSVECGQEYKEEAERTRSSWDSSNWLDKPPLGVPLPPDRRLHESFEGRLEALLDSVEDEPGRLFMSVSHRRRGQIGDRSARQVHPEIVDIE